MQCLSFVQYEFSLSRTGFKIQKGNGSYRKETEATEGNERYRRQRKIQKGNERYRKETKDTKGNERYRKETKDTKGNESATPPTLPANRSADAVYVTRCMRVGVTSWSRAEGRKKIVSERDLVLFSCGCCNWVQLSLSTLNETLSRRFECFRMSRQIQLKCPAVCAVSLLHRVTPRQFVLSLLWRIKTGETT